MEGLKKTTEMIHEDRLNELAKDPKNRVYKHVYDQVERNMSSSECRAIVVEMWNFVKQNRSRKTLDLRNLVYDHDEKKWKEFIDSHQNIFLQLTDPKMTDDLFKNAIMYMLFVKYQQEENAITEMEAQKMVSERLQMLFKHTDVKPKDFDAFIAAREKEEEEYKRKIETREI